MSEVLVTGGTGLLGRGVVGALTADGHAVRVLTRRPAADPTHTPPPGVRYKLGDLRSVTTLLSALDGVDTVVHCASDPRHGRAVDVEGTARLVEAMRQTGAGHLVYVSIVGVDRIPLGYYRVKLETEQVVERCGFGWTVQRATQFHQLLDTLLGAVSRSPVVPLPRGLRFQPVDPADLAQLLARQVAAGPAGRAPDFGGPEVHGVEHLARTWLAAHHRRRLTVPAPLPGKVGRALRSGANLCPGQAQGSRSWQEYLADSARSAAAASPP